MSMDVPTALKYLKLDGHTINSISLKTAFKDLAKEYHPDLKSNFVEKLAATEIFQELVTARDLLEKSNSVRLKVKQWQLFRE